MSDKLVYVIISSSNWAQPKVKYRRHRLVDYLYQQKDTVDIIWAYPVSATPRKPKSYFEAEKVMRKNPYINEAGIKEWALPDFIPGRYMQFKSSFGSLQFAKLKRFINDYEAKKILWFTYPAFPYISEMLKWDMIVYDCSDLWTEPSGGYRSNTFSSKTVGGLIDSAEKRIIKNSKIIFASSNYLAERIKAITGRQVITVENGVDLFYFWNKDQTKNNRLDNIPRPRLGYLGAMRSKIDFALLDELANRNPGWNIVLIGPDCLNNKDTFKKMLQRGNVYWTGEIQQETVPDHIKCLDVGLLPYRETNYNKAVFPIKFFEYLSQGIPVVGCGIPSTNKYAEYGIYLHVGRDNFQEACKKALSWLDYDDDIYTGKRIKLAQESGWDKKLSQMLSNVREKL